MMGFQDFEIDKKAEGSGLMLLNLGLKHRLKGLLCAILLFSPIGAFCEEWVPLYRFNLPSSSDHLYTTDPNGEGVPDRQAEGDIGYIAMYGAGKPDGAVELHRLYSASITDHLYVISDREVQDAQNGDYKYEGVVGYVYPNGNNPETQAVHRVWIVDKDHFYTTNAIEAFAVAGNGNGYEGTPFYTKTQPPKENRAPQIAGPSFVDFGSITESGEPITYELQASDPDGGALNWFIASMPAKGALEIDSATGNSTTLLFTPPSTISSQESVRFEIEVRDSTSLTDKVFFSVTINPEIVPPPPEKPQVDDGGSCFIATAAYGSYLEPEVFTLRQFRDKYLLQNSLGKKFVQWYYDTSPPLAEHIRESKSLRIATRFMLTPVVYLIKYPVGTGGILAFLIAFMLFRSNGFIHNRS